MFICLGLKFSGDVHIFTLLSHKCIQFYVEINSLRLRCFDCKYKSSKEEKNTPEKCSIITCIPVVPIGDNAIYLHNSRAEKGHYWHNRRADKQRYCHNCRADSLSR